MFDNMLDYVYIDKKWFFLIVDRNYYYLTPEEELSFDLLQHKRHIIKLLCLAAVACPWLGTKRHWMWDGKLGIWPFAHQVPAK